MIIGFLCTQNSYLTSHRCTTEHGLLYRCEQAEGSPILTPGPALTSLSTHQSINVHALKSKDEAREQVLEMMLGKAQKLLSETNDLEQRWVGLLAEAAKVKQELGVKQWLYLDACVALEFFDASLKPNQDFGDDIRLKMPMDEKVPGPKRECFSRRWYLYSS